MPFVDYTGTEFVPFLLPIIPKGSRLSEGSNLTPEGIGKVPGLRGQDGRWYGFKGFTKHLCRDDVLPAWARFYQLDKRTETIGCLGRELPLIDQDADHPVIAEIARRRALDVLGPAPVRGRPNSHKFGLLYRLKPGTPFITKKRWVFHDAWDTQYAIEVLGSGEQYVLEGEHPSGVCYEYEMGMTPLVWGFDHLTQITGVQLGEFQKAVRADLEAEGFSFEKLGAGGGSGNTTSNRFKIDENHPDQCPDLDLLADWMMNCPSDSPQFASRDEWLRITAAIKASCAGSEYVYNLFAIWTDTPTWHRAEDQDEYVRGVWESIHDSALGWSYVCAIGQDFGWEGLVRAMFDELPVDDDHPAAPAPRQNRVIGTSDKDVANAIVELYARKRWIYTPEHGRRIGGGWRQFKDGLWRDDDTLLDSVANACHAYSERLLENVPSFSGTPAQQAKQREQYIQAAGSFKSHPKIRNVYALVKADARMRVHKDELDANPLIIGVPGGYIDENGVLQSPDPSKLITKQMLVAPDPDAKCPKFTAQLELICNGDRELVKAMKRLIGYTMTGFNNEQIFVFLHGEGGTGKTHFVKVIHDIMGEYATRGENTTFAKLRGERRSFDLSAMEGFKMAFISEINKGMEWDEARLKEFTGGDGLFVEAKNRDHRAFKTPPLCWFVGNRVPLFREGGKALERRIILFNPDRKFEAESRVLDYAGFLVKTEGGAIMRDFVQWRQEYLQDGLYIPQQLLDSRGEYFTASDRMGQFFDDECEFGEGFVVTKQEAFERHCDWCVANKYNPEGKILFLHDLENHQKFKEGGASCDKKRLTPGRRSNQKHVIMGMRLVPLSESTVVGR